MQTQLDLEAYTRPKKWHGMLCKKRLVLVTNFIRKKNYSSVKILGSVIL